MNVFNQIIVPDEEEGAIDGRSYRFLFDTGTGRTSVAYDDYTATLEAVEKRESSGAIAKQSNDLIVVPRLEVGSIVAENVTLARMAKGQPNVRNFLGMDMLKELACHFLFDENRMLIVASTDLDASENLQPLSLDKANHPYLEVRFGEQKANVTWDTGASITVVDLNFVQRHPEFFQIAGRSLGTDSTGAAMETPMFMMSGATIGGKVFPPHKVAGVDLSHVNAAIERPMNMILGYNTICKANWIFDFPGKRWVISKWLGE